METRDAFESAAAHAEQEFGGDDAPHGETGAAPEPQRKRGRGRPPKHGRYSKHRDRTRVAGNIGTPHNPAPEIHAPIFDKAQLGIAVEGLLTALAAATDTAAPVRAETESLGTTLAHGLENSALGIDKGGPWTPFMIAVSMYALPRAIEAAHKYAERKAAREVAAVGDFSRVAEVVSPAPSIDATPAENPGAGGGMVAAVGVGRRARR